jgi:hypothetical protein
LGPDKRQVLFYESKWENGFGPELEWRYDEHKFPSVKNKFSGGNDPER